MQTLKPARSGLKLVAGAVLAGLLAVTGPALAGKKDDTIRFAYDQAPESVDPFFNNVRIGVIIGANVWDTLVTRDPNTNEYKGSWPRAGSRSTTSTIEFDLRQGVKFHNGEEFDADSVVYTLNFVADPANKVDDAANVNWIDKAEKLDKYKVRLTTKAGRSRAAIDYLAGPVVIHPAKYYAEVGPKGQNAKPVGTRPVPRRQLRAGQVDHAREESRTTSRTARRSQAKIGKVEIRFIPDRQTQMAEMLSGGADLIMHVPKDQADQAAKVPHLQVLSGETMRIAFMQLNTLDNTPTPGAEGRRACARRSRTRSTARRSSRTSSAPVRACCTRQCFPSQFGCTDQGAARYAYDPALAKKLLAEAGFPNGFETEIDAYRERNQTEAIINYLQAGRHQGQAQLLAVRRHARRDPRRQGRADAPDLGLVLGQRRVGVHAGVFRRRGGRRHARQGSRAIC